MNDTTPEAAARFDALMRARSGAERLEMANEMFNLARTLVMSNVLAAEPGISDAELRVRLFERLYGEDVDLETRTRVIARIRAGRRP